jgi:hypothetical protein
MKLEVDTKPDACKYEPTDKKEKEEAKQQRQK